MRISLTGRVSIEANGASLDERSLPGRQGRLVFAYLLAEEGRPVPRDELAEVLWGDAPPATWEKALAVLVSKLRAVLEECGVDGQAALRSAFGCYQLVLPPGAWIDVAAAREAAARAEAALDAGDLGAAREAAEEAVVLARRSFLPGEDGAWIEGKRRELSELLVGALECLADACLIAGDAREAVGHAEELTTLEPYREGGYRRLMQAHAAAGDNAEALRVYERCRRLLADELGAYPSPETESIYRDLLRAPTSEGRAGSTETGLPAIEQETQRAAGREAARPSPETPRVGGRRRRRRIVLAALVVVSAVTAAVAIGATVVRAAQDESEPSSAGAAALDPKSGEILETVALGSAPSSVAVGEGSVWVLDADDRTISQIDPETREVVRTFGTATTPTDIAAGAGALWVGNGSRTASSSFPVSISRLDPATGLDVATINLRPPWKGHLFGVLPGLTRQHIAVTHDAVWVINADLSVSRIDPDTNRVVAVVEDVHAWNIAAGDGRVWITEDNGVAEIDQGRNVVARRIAVGDDGLAEIAVGAGAVWAADPFGGRIWRVTPDPKVVKRAIEVETWVAGLTFGEGAVWATNEIADLVYRIDPRTNRLRVVRGAAAPRGVGAGDGAVWVAASTPPSRDAGLPESACGDVAFGGSGRPDVLLVSDLPLRGPPRELTQPMVDAFRLVLEQRGYEAGGLSVGYQSCDNSTAQSGDTSDFFRCGSNAKAYARNLRVVGVFGTYHSPCSWLEIPIANAAPEGPLVMISPSNTLDELTEDEGLYPTGTRNFVRLAAASHYQGPAQVELAKQLGSRRTFVLVSRFGEYGTGYVPGVRSAARSGDLAIVGSATFDPEADSFTRLVREVADVRPDSVIVVGLLNPGPVRLIRELRAALGPSVPVIAPDAFAGDDLMRLGGSTVEGMYVTQYGVPNSHLSPRGKQLLEDVADARNGDAGPDFAASYGAQAAEILLDAIARSDGTRASVASEVRRTKVVGGILGDVSFDGDGDLVEGPVTILRVEDGEFVVDRVVRVSPPPARP